MLEFTLLDLEKPRHPKKIDRVFNINLFSPWLLISAFAKQLPKDLKESSQLAMAKFSNMEQTILAIGLQNMQLMP